MTMTQEQLHEQFEKQLDEYEKEFRKKAGFTPDEPITEDMITKSKELRLVDIAMRKAVHSSILKEHILKKYR